MDNISKIADRIAAEFEDELIEDEDPNFVAKVRALRSQLNKLSKFKRKKLSAFGIGTLRGRNTVEDLIDALNVITSGGSAPS